MKAPAIQFYVKDWRNNLKLRRCSWAARGVWTELICILHDAEEYGAARMTLRQLAGVAAVPLKLLRELVDNRVLKGGDHDVQPFIFTPKHAGKFLDPVTLLEATKGPLWYSSRMVRDEYIRQRRGTSTRFKERPELSTTPKPTPKPEPKPPLGDGPAVAVALDISSSSDRSRERAVDKSPGVAKTKRQLAAQAEAEAKRAPPPGGSVAAFVEKAIGKPPKPTNGQALEDPAKTPEPVPTAIRRLGDDLDHHWRETPDGVDHAGAALGMARLAFETDPEYIHRIEARIALDTRAPS
jgi:hypothetical protein